MRIKPLSYGILVFALFWGIIGGAMAVDLWVTKQPAPQVGTAKSVEDIKGWMNVEQISEALTLPVPEVINRLSLPQNTDRHKSLKELAAQQGKTADELKLRLFDPNH